jgi:phosphonate transport system substrate-binding protein
MIIRLFATLIVYIAGLFGQTGVEVYSFSAAPQFSVQNMHQIWAPIINEISKQTGKKIELKLFDSIPKFESAMKAGEIDFAFVNPYIVTKLKKNMGYEPIIRDSKTLSGVLLVKNDSPIKNVKELEGKTIVFPTPTALAASLLLRAQLQEKEGIKFHSKYVNSHTNVYLHILTGKSAAGGSVNKALALEREDIKSGLRVLYKTVAVAPHPIVAHKRVPKEMLDSFKSAIVSLSLNTNFGGIMTRAQMSSPVEAVYERDYLPIDKLKLEKYLSADND